MVFLISKRCGFSFVVAFVSLDLIATPSIAEFEKGGTWDADTKVSELTPKA